MFYVFLAITSLFIAVLVARKTTRTTLCAICAGVALTWLGLAVLYKTGRFHDPVLLSLLVGQSIVGIFYWVRRRVPPVLNIFALPFLLTMIAAAYWLITSRYVLAALGLLAFLWLVAWLIFNYRNDPGKKPLAEAALDCCGEDK